MRFKPTIGSVVAACVVVCVSLYWFRPHEPGGTQGQKSAVSVGKVKATQKRAAAVPMAQQAVAQEAAKAGAAKVVLDPVQGFDAWSARYVKAETAERVKMLEEGVKLAQERRPIFKELIKTDPKAALAGAVPMVVRQKLPPEILEQLEKRINQRAAVTVYQGTPVPGDDTPARSLTHRIAQLEGSGAYNLHVYGRREQILINVPNAAINGIGIDREIAANEDPVRVLEVGEVPDESKTKVTVCPVSGLTTANEEQTAEPVTEVQAETVVETPEQIVYLCGGYHKPVYSEQLVYGEGATGGPTSVGGPLPAAPTPALGQLRVLYIPLTFQDQNAIPATESTCYQVMRDVANYYLQSSFGKLTTLTTVTPPVKLPKNEAWYVQKDTSNSGDVDGLGLEMTHAREEARRIGFDYNSYDVTVVRLNGGARSTGGWGGGGNVWVYSDSVNVCAHEIGHTFGLNHANYWDTSGTSAIGPGANAEYGDQYDVMGGGSVPTDHYNVAAKNQIKWLPDNFVQNITTSGQYRLYAMDQPVLDPRNRYALTIVKDPQRTYWGELRQLYTGNATRPWVDKGMLLGWKFPALPSNGGSNIMLIDTTPGSPYGKDDAPIALGQTFDDTEAGIFITTVGISSTTPKYVDVVVNMGDFTGNSNPTLTLASSSDTIPLGGTVTFTATAADVDGDTLAYQWQHWGDTTAKIVSPNAAVITRTFATAGSYVVSCTVSDMKGGSITRTKFVTVGNGNSRYTISGRITAGGVGVPNVLLNANGLNPVISDQDGYYIIANLAANTYSVTPLLFGYSFTELFNNSITVGPNFTGANFDADALIGVGIAVVDGSATENSGTDTASFRITRGGDTTQPLTVNVTTATGTAATGDYTLNPAVTTGTPFNSFTIPADSSTLDVVVTTVNDATIEGPETLIYSLAGGSGYLVTPNAENATITIIDDDTVLPQVGVKATTDTTEEGDATPGAFTFTRTGAVTSALTINYTVSGGTATPGTDYTALSGAMVIPSGAASAVLNVATLDDSLVESLETVKITLSTGAAYVLLPSLTTATVSIIDDDTPTVTVTATDATATEVDLSQPGAAADTGTFMITRTGDTSAPLTVYYSMAGAQGSGVPALNGVDYEALAGVVQIPAGAAAVSVTVIPRWDTLGESAEQVVLQLGAGPTNYLVGANAIATVTINDGAGNTPYVEVDNISVASEPSTSGKFRFSLKGSVAGTVAVKFALTGTATLTSDYTVTLPTTTPASTFDTATGTGTVVISSTGATANTVDLTIAPVNDATAEDMETIICSITAAATYQTFVATSSATMWLKDDEQPTVWVDGQINTGSNVVNRITENAATSPRKFYLSRTGATTSALSVNFAMLGSATAGSDYTITTSATLTFDNASSTGVLTIPAGSSGADVSFNLIDDATFEGTETMICHLNAGAYSKTPDAILYIDDNETSSQKVAFDTTGASGLESVGSVSIPVSLTTAATATTTVDYVVDSGARTSTTTSITAPTLPYWVRVVRSGTALSSYYSTDGSTWKQTGSTQTISMSSSSYTAGIMAASNTTSATCVATVDSVSVSGLDAGGAAGSLAQATIGTSTPASSSTGPDGSGVYVITAGGTDLSQSGTADVCRYLSFPITNSANCTVTARIVSITGGATSSKAGAMIRETTATTSKHMAMTAQKDGTARTVYRVSTTGTTVALTTLLRPYWVKVQRSGNLFSGWQSPDGATWTQVGTTQTLPFSSEVQAGLAVSARSDGLLGTATFDNVSISTVPTLSLQGRTIGFVNAQGSDALSGGVYTVTGSGALIGGTEDECHFVTMPVTGDFSMIARVTSQSGGNTNAQAGLMLRDGYNNRGRSVYIGMVANALGEFIYRNTSVTTAFGDGIDYTLPGGTLTFNAGDLTQNISLSINDDTIAEPDEAITFILRNPNGAQLGTNTTFTYTVEDNDTPPVVPSVQFAASTSTQVENAGTVGVQLSLSAVATTSVTVDYSASGGTATGNGTDYTLSAGTVTFAPGDLVQTIPITLTNDGVVEGPETVIITLTNPVSANLGSLSAHTLTITDDLPVVTLAASDASASEAGLDTGTFTLTRTGPTTAALAVTCTRSGTATSGTDYAAIASTFILTVPAGSATATVIVTPIQDSTNEGAETVILTLSSGAAYSIGTPSTATVTIADDDRSTVTVAATDAVASETPGNTGQFTVTRSAPTTGTLSVSFSLSGTATNGTDYTSITSPLAFAANEVSKTLTVTPVNDALTEGDETVTLQLSSGSYDIGGTGYDVVTIQDNDSPPVVYVTSPGANGPLISSGQGVVVSASVSDDGAPQPVTVNWSQASGPGTAIFATPTQSTCAVTFTADGVYVLRITATDGQFTVSDQVTVIVGSAIAPADWIAQDLGATTQQRGQSTQIGTSYILSGMGAGYATTADGAHVMARQVSGDGSITARLTTQTGTASAPLSGVTIRDSYARSANRAVLGYSGGALQFRTRTTISTTDTVVTQSSVSLPVWIKLDRTGSTVTASYAPDVGGTPGSYTTLGTATTITMADANTQMGLTSTLSSSTAGLTCSATFDHVTLTPTPSGPAVIIEDFGVATPTASTFSLSGDTYAIGGSGSMDAQGAFYGWQYQGDVMVTVREITASSTALNAHSGIMLRESMDATAAYIHLGRCPTSSFGGYFWRTLANGSSGSVPSFTTAARWMRLIRQGNRVTAYHAVDNAGTPGAWAQLGQPQTIIMNAPVLVGLAVDNGGGAAGVLNNCTFSNLSIVPLNKAPVVSFASMATYPLSPLALDATVTDDSFPTPISLLTTWTRQLGPGTVVFGDPTLVDTTATLSQAGTYVLRLTADDSSVLTFKDLAFVGYTKPFEIWQAQNWAGSGGFSDPAADQLLDADFDGQANLLEYAFGTAPQTRGNTPLVYDTATVSTEKYLRLTVPKNTAATDVTFTVEATSDMSNSASWSSAGLTIEQNTPTTLRVRDSQPMSAGGKRFMRVKVVRN